MGIVKAKATSPHFIIMEINKMKQTKNNTIFINKAKCKPKYPKIREYLGLDDSENVHNANSEEANDK